MLLNAYCFLDTKTGVHSSPFFVGFDTLAIRAAVDLADDTHTTIGKHPYDFVLLRVGEFDDNLATLAGCAPVNLGVVGSLHTHSRTRPTEL